MSTQIIPERVRVTCDACGNVCTRDFGPSRRIQEGRLILKRHALDHMGMPRADGSIALDLCDACLGAIERAINAEAQKLRKASDHGG